jgi:mannose-6-phosphate isomerase-like protein (cupin superfamily)
MSVFVSNIEQDTLKNNLFRNVLFTTKQTQLVIMSLKPQEDIGMETHAHTDQFIRVEKGKGIADLNGKKYKLEDGSAVVIPAGTRHNIINMSRSEPMKLYTIYTPPEHDPHRKDVNKPLND